MSQERLVQGPCLPLAGERRQGLSQACPAGPADTSLVTQTGTDELGGLVLAKRAATLRLSFLCGPGRKRQAPPTKVNTSNQLRP